MAKRKQELPENLHFMREKIAKDVEERPVRRRTHKVSSDMTREEKYGALLIIILFLAALYFILIL